MCDYKGQIIHWHWFIQTNFAMPINILPQNNEINAFRILWLRRKSYFISIIDEFQSHTSQQ